MIPIFVFVLSDGTIWASSEFRETPTGTILATYRVNSGTSLVKLGTVSGNSGSYAASGSTGKLGSEVHGR
jgi:hypothetical protein